MARSKQVEGQLDFFALLSFDDNDESEEKSVEEIKISELSPFEECEKCWCRDCKHNENNDGIPREFAGEKKACPACSFCIDNDEPDVCIIGSYKNGCSLRAEEEGISPET
ncbi:MAG: hypothetical protein K6A38_01705 [Lachnospiraceae bacterium]|nr:hypothetical protein [Lachnospiraceae bacterium]